MLGELIDKCPQGFGVLVGSGAAFFGGLEVGSVGGILAVADLAPEWCCQVVAYRLAGEGVSAGAVQERLTVLHKKVVGAVGVPGVKAALDLLGQVGGPPRMPLRTATEKERASIRAALDEVGLLEAPVAVR